MNDRLGYSIESDHDSYTLTSKAKIVMPGEVLESCLVSGAKKNKLGTQFKSGVMIPQDSLIVFDDMHQAIEELFNMGEKYCDARPVRIQKNTVIRYRPIFPSWKITTEIHYDETVLNRKQILDVLFVTGSLVGLCDYRPKFGRFTVSEEVNSLAA